MRATAVERETLEAVFMEAVDAWNDRDFERFLACFHPAIEYESLLARVEGGSAYRGHRGMERYWQDLSDGVDRSELKVEKLEWMDDVLVVTGEVKGSGRSSGAPIEYHSVQVARYREGLISWCATHTTRAAALAAAHGES